MSIYLIIADQNLYQIKGPLITSGCFSTVRFEIKNMIDGRQVGTISKEWSALCTEYTSNTDRFNITFVDDANISDQMKAVLIGGLFLIDFKYFESSGFGCCCCR